MPTSGHPRPVHEVYAALRDLYPALPGLALQAKHRPITHVLHGWYMRLHRSCEAVLVLGESGYAAEAWPLRRAVTDHLVALWWLSEEDGATAATAIRRRHSLTAASRLEAAKAAGWDATVELPIWEEVANDLKGTESAQHLDNILTNFWHRREKFGRPEHQADWSIDSHHSHPSWETARPYITDTTPMTMLLQPEFHGRDDMGWCAAQEWEALWLVNTMLEKPLWDAELEAARVDITAHLERPAAASGGLEKS